ncbi:MAG: YHYH protein [Cyclobacteriaceae bacterium]
MLKINRIIWLIITIFTFVQLQSCDSAEAEEDEIEMEDEQEEEEEETTADNDISILAEKFYHSDALEVVIGDEFITITSSNQPDHESMYYPRTSSLYASYEEPDNPDFKKNPNEIEIQNHVYKIPRFPVEASSKSTTPMGPMGVAVNSVAFLNQAAAPGDDILEELNTFDQYEGHPAQGGNYHYHIEPTWLTQSKLMTDSFLGLLLDGFPVYGPVENGVRLTNNDLDDYHGHVSATAEFPKGIYHYHVTDDLPWINGDGFFGTPGTISR